MTATVCENVTSAFSTITAGNTADNCGISYTYMPSVTTGGYIWRSCNCGCTPDKTGKALAVLRVLMDQKVIKVGSIEKFIKVLDKIQKVL